MKTNAIKRFREKRYLKQPLLGLWVTLESASITEMAVALGLDWVVIDAEHGHLDWREILDHVRAAVRSSTVALVRIAELNTGLIKRALDIGADGIVIPMVESAEQLCQAIQYAKYPLEGTRGIGAERATAWGQAFSEHAKTANDDVLVIPIVETERGSRNLPSILKVDGCETIFFGPADLSASMGSRGEWEGPGVAETILSMKNSIVGAGKSCGILAKSIANVHERIDQGFGMIGLGVDSSLLIRSIRETLASLDRDCAPTTSLEPCISANTPIAKPPESF